MTAWRSRIVGQGTEDPAQLVANPANWRTHPAIQRDALRGSLDTVGWVQQVLVNRITGHVVDGHARVEEAISRGEPLVPVLYVELEPDEERLVLATLDPIGALAERSSERLADLLAELRVDDDGLRRLLGRLAPPRQGLLDPDAIPEPPTEPRSKLGDLWILGGHRLVCGDATNSADVEHLLDGEAPKLLATDPPYGVSLDPRWRDNVYNGLGPAELPYMQLDPSKAAVVPTRANKGARGRLVGHRNTTISGDTRIDWSAAFALVPSLSVGYVWHAGVHAATVAAGLVGIGFEIVSQVIWDKGLFAMGRSWYHWAHEPCWVVRRPGVGAAFLGERNQATIWRAPSPKMIMAGSDEPKFDHPAQKPVLLYEIPIRNHLEAGDWVYDPFAGSGTSLVAAERLGRRCLALELEPRYVDLILARWEGFTGLTALRVDG